MDRPARHDTVAALPMYDWPEVRAANDAFWAAVRDRLKAERVRAPDALLHDLPAGGVWRHPKLFLGQTCGLPFVRGLCGSNLIVARPDYGVEGARGGDYRSALVVRREAKGVLDDFRGTRAAVNGAGSQSGTNALLDAVGEDGFFRATIVSGAHRISARMVAEGAADLAAIDGHCWSLLVEVEPETVAALRVLAWTRPMPALPFITADPDLVAPLRRALSEASATVRAPGVPVAILPAGPVDYAPIRQMDDNLAGQALS